MDTYSEIYDELKKEIAFLSDIVNTLPATLHILEVDNQLKTLPVWANKTYEEIIGYNLEERTEIGYAGKDSPLYHPDDIKSVQETIVDLMKHPNRTGAIVYRIKHKKGQFRWIYMLGRMLKRTERATQFICLGIDVNDRLATNKKEMSIYLKEISQLQNEIKLLKLTKVERNVINKFAKGMTTKEVAKTLKRSYDTVNNHKRHIFEKLGIHKVTELVHFAEECGLA